MEFFADLAREDVALIISVLALLLTFIQGWNSRTHNRLSVRPQLATFTETTADPERKGIQIVSIKLSNSGLGPAVIKTFKPILDGVPLRANKAGDLFPVVEKILPAMLIKDECYIAVLRPGHVMATGEAITLAHLVIVPTIHDDPKALEKALDRFHVRVGYKSVYGESLPPYDSRDHR